MKIDHGNVSIYVPKRTRNFIKICMLYASEELEITKFSSFVMMCIRRFVNSLDGEERAKFESYAQQLAKQDRPRASKFVDDFIENNKEDQNGS